MELSLKNEAIFYVYIILVKEKIIAVLIKQSIKSCLT